MQQITMKKAFAMGLFSAISGLRFNTSGYPFVTLIGKNQTATNLYFGQKSAEVLGAKYAENDNVTAELKDATIMLVQNADEEWRYKLSLQGDSEYTSEAQLEDLFGVQAATDFDIVAFKKEFTAVGADDTEGADEEDEDKKPTIATSKLKTVKKEQPKAAPRKPAAGAKVK